LFIEPTRQKGAFVTKPLEQLAACPNLPREFGCFGLPRTRVRRRFPNLRRPSALAEREHFSSLAIGTRITKRYRRAKTGYQEFMIGRMNNNGLAVAFAVDAHLKSGFARTAIVATPFRAEIRVDANKRNGASDSG
jgi:hypothetical protein